MNYALRPSGNGIILKAEIPTALQVASPNTKLVQLIQNKSKVVSEAEVLIKGNVNQASVEKVSPQKKK